MKHEIEHLLLSAFQMCVQNALIYSTWLLSVFQICLQTVPWIQCTQCLLTITMVITTRNLKYVEQKSEIMNFQTWSGSQNFSFNLILEFLELADVVEILTIVHSSRIAFVPSSMILSNILQKSLLSSSSDIPFYSITREMRPTLMMISKDKTLTLITMFKVYKFIKETVTNEFKPNVEITVNNRICTWNYTKEDKVGLNFKINFASAQCSDGDCNQIVLWHCSVCISPCSECLSHVRMCEICGENACTSCLLTDELNVYCRDCGYRCVGCDEVFIEDEDPKVICEGSHYGQSCPSAGRPYCSDCAWPDHVNGPYIACQGSRYGQSCQFAPALYCLHCILSCSWCSWKACMDCNCIMICETCKEQCCIKCRPIGKCNGCNRMTCFNCKPLMFCEEVRKTLRAISSMVRLFAHKPLSFSVVLFLHLHPLVSLF